MQWKDYLAKLAAKGVSQCQIAREVGCGQATISDLALGKTKEPRTSLGMALMRIGDRCGIKTPYGAQPSAHDDERSCG
jgi:transcriptional regulator with XRE-family HTH domain